MSVTYESSPGDVVAGPVNAGSDRLIRIADSAVALAAAANANPQLKADLAAMFSQQVTMIITASHSPIGTLIGGIAGLALSQYGIKDPPPWVVVGLSGVGALVVGYAGQWVTGKIAKMKAAKPGTGS